MRTTAAKKSLLLYYEYMAHFDFLSDEQTGKIIKAMLAYEIDGVMPEFDEPIMRMTFSFIRSNLDRDKQKYAERCAINSENGKKGGRPPKNTITEQIETSNSITTSVECPDEKTVARKKEFFSRYVDK